MEKSEFTVLVDEQAIKQAQLTFAENMKKSSTKDGKIIASYQSGGKEMHAYWFQDNKFWWAYQTSPDERIPRWWNAFTFRTNYPKGESRNGEPRWGKQNSITCEINIPFSGNNWQVSGAFVKDQNNVIYIVHTGKIGGGREGVGKTLFKKNFPDKDKWQEVSGSRGKKKVVIVSDINDPNLVDNVGTFVKAVKELKPGSEMIGGSSSGNGDDSINEKFKAWLERGARKADKSIEDYARDLGKVEYESRYETFPKLKVVLEKEPIDLDEISTVSKITTCIGDGAKVFGEHWSNRLLTKILKNERAKEAVKALTGYKNETDMHTFLEIVKEIMPAKRERAGNRQVGEDWSIDPAQMLLIASVFLTALDPTNFVDLRVRRWESLAKEIGIEDEFASAKDCSTAARPEEIGKFAKMIIKTQTFKDYWGDQSQPLWTLAGICWTVKESKKDEGGGTDMDEGNDTDMDGLVEEILNKAIDKMDFKLAIEEDVVKRVIRHLRGGKNVVLVGAPGVGKTELAIRVLSVVGDVYIGNRKFHPAVAYAEWTRRQVIGGLNLKNKFEPGCVTIAAENNQWLLIDEFNRADINKAFGEMFLGIESNKITLGEAEADAREKAKKDRDITIPKKFRMVCTMNDFDKNLLLTELSYGLITRFAFVDIIPDENEEVDSIKKQIGADDEEKLKEAYQDCEKVIEKFYEFIHAVRKNRMIGVRTCIDVIRYTVSASKKEGKDKVYQFLDEALCDYLWPQFDRLDKQVIKDARDLSKKHLPEATKFRENLEKRYEELKKLSAWMGGDEPEAKDAVLSPVQTKKSIAGKKNENPEIRTAAAIKAAATMKFYRDNSKKINPATGLTGIEWAKDKGHNDPYGYSKIILGKDWKKYSKKKKT